MNSKKDKTWKDKKFTRVIMNNRRVSIPVMTMEQALEQGMSSSLVRTISRGLDRLARDCFRRVRDEDFTPRWPGGETETKASLTEAGKINETNAYELRLLGVKMKKAGY